MEYKCFNNEREAMIYRSSKRDDGSASSLFTYGKDRYLIQSKAYTSKEDQQENQIWLSRRAWTTSKDIEDLGKVAELIASPDFGCEIEDTVFTAKYLQEQHWFATINSVITFFDCPSDSIEKIKEMVDIAQKEYDDEWNEYLEIVKDLTLA